jgi:hypothetical protein
MSYKIKKLAIYSILNVFIYVIPPHRFSGPVPHHRAVVRNGLSAALVLSLLLLALVCFMSMVGPQTVPNDSPKIGKGRFSDNHALHLLPNVP